MSLLIALAAGMWVTVLLNLLLTRNNQRLRERLQLTEERTEPPEPQPSLRARFQERWVDPTGRTVLQIIPIQWVSFVRRRLRAAGLVVTVEHFLGRWILLITAWYLGIGLISGLVSLPVWVRATALVGVLLAPVWSLNAMEVQRIRQIRRTFPFMVDFISMAVEAGVSLEASLARAGHRLKGPLGHELQRYVRNIGRGMPRHDALMDFAEGIGLPEVREFTRVLIQSNHFGLPMTVILRNQAQHYREVQRQQAEESAQKIPVKLLIPMVLFIFPAIFLVVLGPAIIWLSTRGM